MSSTSSTLGPDPNGVLSPARQLRAHELQRLQSRFIPFRLTSRAAREGREWPSQERASSSTTTLEYSSTLPAELQRLLNTMRELDERSQAMINQSREQTKYCLGLSSQNNKKGHPEDDEFLEKMKREIEVIQENALSLCTEKVLLAKQAYDLIDSQMKRLEEDLSHFSEDLKQEGKIPQDEPTVLPPVVVKDERKKTYFGTPQTKRLEFREREWDRERDRDFELMPPPGSHKRSVPAPVDVDQPIDPNEPTYCVCHQVSFGDMIACDNENCEGGEWFHYACVGLSSETRFKGKWYCPTCKPLYIKAQENV